MGSCIAVKILVDLILAQCIFNGYKQLELIPDVQLFIFPNSGPNNLKVFLCL